MITADMYESKDELGKHLLLFRHRRETTVLIGIFFNFVYAAVAAMDESVLQGGFLTHKFQLIGRVSVPVCLEYFACNKADAEDCFSARKILLLHSLLDNLEEAS